MAEEEKLVPRHQDSNEWYNTLVLKADLADYGPVRGTMIIKSDRSYALEALRGFVTLEYGGYKPPPSQLRKFYNHSNGHKT